MHELITCVGSLIIVSLLITQYVANVNLFNETVEIERTIKSYVDEEYEEEQLTGVFAKLINELNNIPNVNADRADNGVNVTISGIVGPFKACGISDNSIKLYKKLDFSIRESEEEDEEFDNNSGTIDSDGSSK